jgi:hypothetical protein
MPTQSIVVGILSDDDQAHKIVDDLRSAGFSTRDIGAASENGELVVQDNSLARADVAGHGLVDVLVGMGVPEQGARVCQRDFAARRTVLTVQTRDRANEVVKILQRNRAERVRRW